DAAETPFGDRQGSLRGTQAHRRTGIRSDQIRAGNPQVFVTRTGEGVGRVATDLLDPQSSEDLAPLRQGGDGLGGGCAAPSAGAGAKRARARRNPGAMRSTGKYS